LHRFRVAQVEAGTGPVPPADDGGLVLGVGPKDVLGFLGVQQEHAFLGEVTEVRRIRADERADPEHDLEAHRVQLPHHRLRILEASRRELKGAVILLPVVIDHQDPRRVSVLDDGAGIGQNGLLVLVIHQLDPGVVLRMREE
jgi:hypothetical protein